MVWELAYTKVVLLQNSCSNVFSCYTYVIVHTRRCVDWGSRRLHEAWKDSSCTPSNNENSLCNVIHRAGEALIDWNTHTRSFYIAKLASDGTAFLNSTVFLVKQAKMLKIGSHLQYWCPSGLVPCVWNPMIIQTWVRIPKSIYYYYIFLGLVANELLVFWIQQWLCRQEFGSSKSVFFWSIC